MHRRDSDGSFVERQSLPPVAAEVARGPTPSNIKTLFNCAGNILAVSVPKGYIQYFLKP